MQALPAPSAQLSLVSSREAALAVALAATRAAPPAPLAPEGVRSSAARTSSMAMPIAPLECSTSATVLIAVIRRPTTPSDDGSPPRCASTRRARWWRQRPMERPPETRPTGQRRSEGGLQLTSRYGRSAAPVRASSGNEFDMLGDQQFPVSRAPLLAPSTKMRVMTV